MSAGLTDRHWKVKEFAACMPMPSFVLIRIEKRRSKRILAGLPDSQADYCRVAGGTTGRRASWHVFQLYTMDKECTAALLS